MNDKSLLAIKHGRVMLPLSLLMGVLTALRLASDELVVQQIFGIGRMLIGFILVLYALDSIVQLVGLCDDRLLLSSPIYRWKLTTLSASILGMYLLLATLIGMVPDVMHEGYDVAMLAPDLISYVVSVITGLGLMVMIAYMVKNISSRTTLRISAWLMYIATTGLLAYGSIKFARHYVSDLLWMIGATNVAEIVNVYAGMMPITLLNVSFELSTQYLFCAINFAIGCIFWMVGWMLSKKRNNYLEVR